MFRIMVWFFALATLIVPAQGADRILIERERNAQDYNLGNRRIDADIRNNDQTYEIERRRIDAEQSSRRWETLGRMGEITIQRGSDVLIWNRQAKRDENVATIWAERDKTVNRDEKIVQNERDRLQACSEFEARNPGWVCRWEGDKKIVEPLARQQQASQRSTAPSTPTRCANCGGPTRTF